MLNIDGIKAGGVEQAGGSWTADETPTGHYGIDSTTIRAHVSAAGEKGRLIDRLLAAREAGSAVKFAVLPMPAGERPPFI